MSFCSTTDATTLAAAFFGQAIASDWSWVNPLPQGNDLRDVWCAAPNDIWAVRDTGTLLHYDGTSCTLLPRATLHYSYGWWGFGPCDVFIVGQGGTILRYGGGDPGQPVLVNGGFEVPLDTTGGWPAKPGYWRGDWTSVVTAENGITPSDGNRMLKFGYTGRTAGASAGTGSQVFQGVDLRSLHDSIAQGDVVARVRVRYNRVAGDAQTDTAFVTDVYAYAGDPDTSATQINNGTHLSWRRQVLYSDADPNTWEASTVELTLPANTDFIAVMVDATGNVYNDTTGVELDGHYCDAVTLEVFRLEHVLTLNVVNGSWGSVEAEPNLSTYPAGTPVTLTATPIEGKYFRHWEVYDPCHPNDANYMTIDANNPLTIIMSADRQVTAVFKCGSGSEHLLPFLVIGLCALCLIKNKR